MPEIIRESFAYSIPKSYVLRIRQHIRKAFITKKFHASGEGGNTFCKGLRVFERRVGVSLRNISSMASTAKAREFIGPDPYLSN